VGLLPARHAGECKPQNGQLIRQRRRPSDFQDSGYSSPNTVNVRDLHRRMNPNTNE
jgi:hypothetical protein